MTMVYSLAPQCVGYGPAATVCWSVEMQTQASLGLLNQKLQFNKIPVICVHMSLRSIGSDDTDEALVNKSGTDD